jgi:hypothetical protein
MRQLGFANKGEQHTRQWPTGVAAKGQSGPHTVKIFIRKEHFPATPS